MVNEARSLYSRAGLLRPVAALVFRKIAYDLPAVG